MKGTSGEEGLKEISMARCVCDEVKLFPLKVMFPYTSFFIEIQ